MQDWMDYAFIVSFEKVEEKGHWNNWMRIGTGQDLWKPERAQQNSSIDFAVMARDHDSLWSVIADAGSKYRFKIRGAGSEWEFNEAKARLERYQRGYLHREADFLRSINEITELYNNGIEI